MALTCPRCDSNQVQSVEMIYQGGVSNSVITGVGTGVAFGSNGNAYNSVNFFKGNSVSTTALAQRLAPPKLNNYKDKLGWVFVWLFGGLMGLLLIMLSSAMNGSGDNPGLLRFFGMIMLIGGGVGAAYNASLLGKAKNDDIQANKDMEIWKKSILCLSCGNTFVYKA